MIVIKIEMPDAGLLVSLVSKACFNSGFYVQSFSLANNTSYIKFDKKTILSKQEEPSDFLIVNNTKNIDASIKNAKEKSTILVISKEKPKPALVKKRKLKMYFLDSSSSVSIFGALSKICPQINQKSARSSLGDDKTSNIAFEKGFAEVKQ